MRVVYTDDRDLDEKEAEKEDDLHRDDDHNQYEKE